jgi:hypothetical protein
MLLAIARLKFASKLASWNFVVRRSRLQPQQ